MSERGPVTTTIKAADARSRWSRILNAVIHGGERVLIERSGVPVAAIISADDLARLQRLEAERDMRFRVIDRARKAFADVPDEELEREVERALADARTQRRNEVQSGRAQ